MKNRLENIVSSREIGVLSAIKENRLYETLIQETIFLDKINQFLDNNHLLGSSQIMTISYGLYNNDELISLMSFKELKKDSGEYELRRYAIKINSLIIGGAEKLLNHFLKNTLGIKSIITYNDNSIFRGLIYKRLRFQYIRTNLPNYQYVSKTSVCRISKQQFRKSVLGYSETETEFTESKGFYKIYNAENDVYKMTVL